MWKIVRRVTKVKNGDSRESSVYDRQLDDTMKGMFGLVFALAKLAKVTPKRFATEVAKESLEYALKFNAELGKILDKPVEELSRKLNKKG